MKSDKETPVVVQDEVALAPAAAPEAMTLTEFCTRLSKSDGRVELIGGFHHSEVAAGNVKGLESDFQVRFAAFINKPV